MHVVRGEEAVVAVFVDTRGNIAEDITGDNTEYCTDSRVCGSTCTRHLAINIIKMGAER
jgi:hypothetical protein